MAATVWTIAPRPLNSTYGAASQTSFYDGAMIYDQWLGGMDASRATSWAAPT
jgi:hypothetical protein